MEAAQRKTAFDGYFMPAVHTASTLGLTSELGIALCFDIHVQNGGVSQAVRGSLPPLVPGAPERIRREAIANAAADHSGEKFRENVRKRKLASPLAPASPTASTWCWPTGAWRKYRPSYEQR